MERGTKASTKFAGCDRGATKPEPKSDATLRAAVLFGPDFVAHSLQTAEGLRGCPCGSTSRLVWAKNPSPQTRSNLWNEVLRSRRNQVKLCFDGKRWFVVAVVQDRLAST